MEKKKEQLAKFYGDQFYSGQVDFSCRSGLKYAELLAPLLNPKSVVDVGCGRGSWLKAFKEKGAVKLVGYDGSWNNQENMIDQSIIFHGVDLNKPILVSDPERFDLAMSLEVAEHLEPSSATDFVGSLTKLSDVVLFSAAYLNQGGTNHINEQPHTYWATIFASFVYLPFDLFRPIVWGDSEIELWYQQNAFLYVRKNAPVFTRLMAAGKSPIQNIAFMDCVHPRLFEKQIGTKASLKRVVLNTIPKPLRPLARRLKQFLD